MILVTGSRGAVATHLISLLRERGLPFRAASSAADAEVTLNLSDPATFAPALEGVTSVFLYANDGQPATFAKEAVAAGVRDVVLLSSASVLAPDADSKPLARSHLEVERALFDSPLQVTSLRPGAFASNALGWAWALRSGRPISLPYPNAHNDAIHEADIAEAALAVLTEPDKAGGPYTLTGPESLSFVDQVEILAAATGRAIPIETVTREQWKAAMGDYMRPEYADALLDWWQSCDGRPATLTSDVETLTGRTPRTFATWARDHAEAFAS
ncbi:NAD(P)H-binding protein [Nonomuraea sediminis]|uniref:NAD(P)H-binding protein n=1 Tax=Nonomuraea sediminis TaxID=2835864 RepID=UPI001BDCE1C8|nr:NAD(P)H-binding protein [Nonomuraea sediminis]